MCIIDNYHYVIGITFVNTDQLLSLFLASYIYCDTVDITSGNVLNLVYLSEKYLVLQLKHQCMKYFRQHLLDHENALEYATLDLIPELHDATMMHIQTYARKILINGYAELTRDTLRQILEKDFLNTGEFRVYLFCRKWAEDQCKKRGGPARPQDIAKELDDLLPLIRFPVIMSDEITLHRLTRDGLLTTEDEHKMLEYIGEKYYHAEKLINVGDRTDTVELHTVLGVPFRSSCVRRSNYGDLHLGSNGVLWCFYDFIDMEEGLESYFCNIFSVQSSKECKKGCLIFSSKVPVSILAFRLQLNELVCHRYSKEGTHVKVMITRKSDGRVQSQYNERLSVCPTVSPVKRFHYHKARFKKPVTLRAGCNYEVVLECESTLYYHGVPHSCLECTNTSRSNLSIPFELDWALMEKKCEGNEAVSDLIHGINFELQITTCHTSRAPEHHTVKVDFHCGTRG